MLKNDIFFIELCFYTIGFLSLAGVITTFLNSYFSSRIYKFYGLYLLVIISFVVMVYIKNTGDFPKKSTQRLVLNLAVDILPRFCLFLNHTSHHIGAFRAVLLSFV